MTSRDPNEQNWGLIEFSWPLSQTSPPFEKCQKLLREALASLDITGTHRAAPTSASCHHHNASISTIWQISYPSTPFPALLMGCVKEAFRSLLLFCCFE
uniref:Uncharacterized protein n=1 Tax=Saimiri boliviensis boliviensis TaxID=39432 RepID=A0A2K6URF3_SAIBB